MKIAICDDEAKDRERIKSFIRTHNREHEIIEYSSAVPLLKFISADESLDVLFLDIQMPDSDGWEVAEQLKKSNSGIYIAMVTINGNYVYDCFDRVDWFASKPVSVGILDKRISAIPKIVRTSVPAINAILVDELNRAKKENVEVRLDINISQTLKINACDLCVLLGNTIENAIEACSLLPDKFGRFIEVSILQDDSLILIDVKNPFDDSNNAASRKSGRHGYGLRNVRKVVKKYGGDIEIRKHGNIYHVSMIIP